MDYIKKLHETLGLWNFQNPKIPKFHSPINVLCVTYANRTNPRQYTDPSPNHILINN